MFAGVIYETVYADHKEKYLIGGIKTTCMFDLMNQTIPILSIEKKYVYANTLSLLL